MLQESKSAVHTARASKRKWCCWWEQDKIKDPMVQFLPRLLWVQEADISVTWYVYIRWEVQAQMLVDSPLTGSVSQMKGVNAECWTKPAKWGQVCVWECWQFMSVCNWLIGRRTIEIYFTFSFPHSICVSSGLSSRGCSSSETESEAGDLLDQQFEELNNKLNSVTDPTGFLRMVSRNNLFNR